MDPQVFGFAFYTGLVAIIAQTGAMFYWGGKISAQLQEHERRIDRLERMDDSMSRGEHSVKV